MNGRYSAQRIDGVWHVIDAADGSSVEIYGPGAAGASEANRAAAALDARAGRVPAVDVRAWRTAHRLSQAGLARALGVQPLAVLRWETGARGVPPYLHLALAELERQASLKAS